MTAVRIETPGRQRAADRSGSGEPMVQIQDLSLQYGDKSALKGISMTVQKHRVTAFIGPSGCG